MSGGRVGEREARVTRPIILPWILGKGRAGSLGEGIASEVAAAAEEEGLRHMI